MGEVTGDEPIVKDGGYKRRLLSSSRYEDLTAFREIQTLDYSHEAVTKPGQGLKGGTTWSQWVGS